MNKLLILGGAALLATGGVAMAQAVDSGAPGATAGMPATGSVDGSATAGTTDPATAANGSAGAMSGMPADSTTGATAATGAMGSGAATPPAAPRQYPVCRSRQQDECRNPGGR